MKNYISIVLFLFVCQLAIGQTCELTEISSTTTPCGTFVANDDPYNGTGVSASEASNYQNNIIPNQYPCATWYRHATTVYNCFAYAFHLSRTNTTDYHVLWINNPSPYTSNGCYSSDYRRSGSKARYYSGGITHAANVTTYSSFTSKWGAWPLVGHSIFCVPPSYGTTINYVRRSSLTASEVSSQAIDAGDVFELNWEMAQDQEGVSGFNLLYVESEGVPAMLNNDLIPANSYEHIQQNGDQYTYTLDASWDIDKVYLEIQFNDGSTDLIPFKG